MIVGLGNPDKQHQKNRHNTGYMALDWFGDKNNAKWQTKTKFQAKIAQIEIGEETLLLVKPTTYYNDSGVNVRKVRDFYGVANGDILVIHDELKLPFGTLRTRRSGSDAGNNGVKGIISHIGADFARIRVGIGWEEQLQTDMDFVLSDFNKTETAKLADIFSQCEKIIAAFANDAFEPTSYTL